MLKTQSNVGTETSRSAHHGNCSTSMSAAYDPKAYWEARLIAHGGLRGTGHISFGENYNRWLYRAKRRTLERALAGVVIRGKQVLDVGCGNGYFVDWYLGQGGKVSGLDFAGRSIEALKRRHGGDFRVLDISAPEAELPSRYDIVNAWDVLYHVVDEAGFRRALGLIGSSVRENGLLLITDSFCAASDDLRAGHVRMRCLATYQTLLPTLGFELVGLQFLFRWMNRYVTLPAIDGRLGRFYYWLDGRDTTLPSNNLSLGVWRRTTSS
jgi:SAM-dependent methyltransferase